jgi:Peptidase family M23
MTTRFQRNPNFASGSRWGPRIDPMSGKGTRFHSGHDYKAEAGTPIPAEIAGEVVYSGFNDNLGNTVIVKHYGGGYSLYAHMQHGDRVKVGQPVWPGDVIGRVGSTGARSTGNHVHYTLIDRKVRLEDTRTGGPIGIKLNEHTTIDPEQYDVDPRYLDETLRAQQLMSARNGPGSALTSDRSDIPFRGGFERSNAWRPGWSVPAPLGGLPGLLMEHVGGAPQQNGPQSSASVFESGAPALRFMPSVTLAPEESDASFDERFKAALPIRWLSSRLPGR